MQMPASTEPSVNASDRPTFHLMGVPISLLDMEGTLRVFQELLTEDQPHLVVTADATAVVIANENPEFMEIIHKAHLVTSDSAGVRWALRKRGVEKPPQVSGVDLVKNLTELSAVKGYRIFFLGSEPGIADRAAERMRLMFPGCNIVGSRHGYFPEESDEVVAQEIAETKPDILLVAMGMPRQEKFILKTMHIINAKVAMGVGGSFDVYSGKTKRAPKIFQVAHCEWLWRLAHDPKKIYKVRKLPIFVWMILRGK